MPIRLPLLEPPSLFTLVNPLLMALVVLLATKYILQLKKIITIIGAKNEPIALYNTYPEIKSF